MSDGDRDGIPPPQPGGGVPTLVWLMLGVLLVVAFVAALVFVFDAPPEWKTSSVGTAARAPASISATKTH